MQNQSRKLQIINPSDLPYEDKGQGKKERMLASKASGSECVSFAQFITSKEGAVSKGVVYPGHDELVYFLTGRGEISVDGEKTIVEPGGFFFVPDGVVYDFAVLEAPIEMIVVFSPPRE